MIYIKKILKYFLLFILLFSNTLVSASEKQKLKVLVIEINPILYSVKNNELYKNNDGHPFVSEYFNQNNEASINEIVEDLEEMSHNYLDVEIVKKEYLNEFPTYKHDIELIDGNKSKRYDENTYIAISRSRASKDVGSWIDMIYYPNNKPTDYTFDYDYIIEKFDLINRKNNGEFDQVWLNTIDPASTYETIMVGYKPYWVNGAPLTYNCDNFIILNISISRRDANLHALSHSFESILNIVFNRENTNYSKNYYNLTDEEYNKLSLFEKFTLSSYQGAGNYSGVGNVHFPFNATKDYDYNNDSNVMSNWEAWIDYPDLSSKPKLSNSSSWLNFPVNKNLGDNENKDPNRLYIRFWLYLFPHVGGYTDEGFYNNWWKYIYSMDYVESITSNIDNKVDLRINNDFEVNYLLNYYSGRTELVKTIGNTDNVHLSGNSIKIEDNKIVGVNYGTSIVTIFHDGSYISYTINVVPNTISSKTLFIVIIISLFIILGIFVIFIVNYKIKEKKAMS